MLSGSRRWAVRPDPAERDEEESVPIDVGRQVGAPTPVFTQLDPKIVNKELARRASEG